MKMNRITLSFAFLIPLFATTFAQELPDRKEVLNQMVLANDYFMKKWPDTGKTIVTNRERPSNIWTRSVYYEGLMALHEIFPREEFYDYAVSWAEFHNWGMRNGNTTRNADDQCCGQTYIDLYNILPEPERVKNIKVCIDMVVNTPQVDDWWWIDAIQMGMPVYAKLGTLFNDSKYYNKMYEMYMYTRNKHGDNGLFNEVDGLWWRDADFDPPYTEPNGEDCYWSRGNGWVVAALVRVLKTIPEDETHRVQYINDFKKDDEGIGSAATERWLLESQFTRSNKFWWQRIKWNSIVCLRHGIRCEFRAITARRIFTRTFESLECHGNRKFARKWFSRICAKYRKGT